MGVFWDPMIERISQRLDEWKKSYFSLGRRITLGFPMFSLHFLLVSFIIMHKSHLC